MGRARARRRVDEREWHDDCKQPGPDAREARDTTERTSGAHTKRAGVAQTQKGRGRERRRCTSSATAREVQIGRDEGERRGHNRARRAPRTRQERVPHRHRANTRAAHMLGEEARRGWDSGAKENGTLATGRDMEQRRQHPFLHRRRKSRARLPNVREPTHDNTEKNMRTRMRASQCRTSPSALGAVRVRTISASRRGSSRASGDSMPYRRRTLD